uniref:Uncharacterized protein Escp117 n=1 Tax=Ectocarpus siliculosus TaxID=2880 RepID=D1J776_ECTSI|nr:Chloroplast hypothetical protein [Ectocarpus siliculosus]CAT18799.1 Chloroplast hypothetical protein [Ectocarpus siliculosus]CAV31260.1 Chloroplast hypothetical protein [Ectocarpus siliculosus]
MFNEIPKNGRYIQTASEFLKLQKKNFNKYVTSIALDLAYSIYMTVNELINTNLVVIAIFENKRRKER